METHFPQTTANALLGGVGLKGHQLLPITLAVTHTRTPVTHPLLQGLSQRNKSIEVSGLLCSGKLEAQHA